MSSFQSISQSSHGIPHTEPADIPANFADSCAQEQIRLPGAVQRHGFMLGLDEEHASVVLASENAEEFLGAPLKLILGCGIDLLLERELLASVRQLRFSMDPEGLVSYLGAFQIRGNLFSVVTHCVQSTRILEFERQDWLVGAEMMNGVITNFVSTLARLGTVQELCQSFTDQFAALTGFDRALLYSFDEEGHGTVLTEFNSGRLPSYVDLRFPATDIPAQARQLYVLNTVRIIPNAVYTPSPLHSLREQAPHALNLSHSVLRSVSPVHLEYMRNMGTMSSMSVSIVSEGRLWGLISGHHAEPRTVPYLIRSACDMLSKMVGTQLTTFRTAARLRTLVHFHGVQRQLLTQIAAESNYLSALAAEMKSVMHVTDATGAVLWDNGVYEHSGDVPDLPTLKAIVAWLDGRPEFELYTTRQLSAELPAAAECTAIASGLLAVTISDVRRRYVLWFKPEVLETVTWAGEPVKKVDEQQRLHPRTSFASWQQELRGQSLLWADVELESAREFRAALVTISLQRAEEEAELNASRFLQLTHNLPTIVFTTDENGTLTYVNERWHEQFPSHGGLWLGEGRIFPEDEKRCAAAWESALASFEPFEEEVRLQNGTDDGVLRWHLLRITPFRREGRRPAGWVGLFLDLTERREREAAMRMTEKLALTGRMTSVIAHEINNPLESITNLMYLLRSEMPKDGNAAEYITMAESELERISGITKQTLRWNRESRTTTETFAVGMLFDDVLRLFHGKIRNRRIQVEVQGERERQMNGVLGQIRQVVANLLSNAIDAAPVGGRVVLSAGGNGDETVIRITDNGPGIAPELRTHLFQPFHSTKGDLGNGLGLYISHEIVERHHGRLQLENAEGGGTTVSASFPMDARPAASA